MTAAAYQAQSTSFNAIHPTGIDCGEVVILDYCYEPADPDCGQGESYDVTDLIFDGRHCSFFSSGDGELIHMPQWLIEQAAAHLEATGGF